MSHDALDPVVACDGQRGVGATNILKLGSAECGTSPLTFQAKTLQRLFALPEATSRAIAALAFPESERRAAQ